MYCKYCGSYVDNDSVFCSTCGERIADDAKSTGESSVSQQSPTPNFIENNSSKKTNKFSSFFKKLNPLAGIGLAITIFFIITVISIVATSDYDYIKGWGWIFLSALTIVINFIAVSLAKKGKLNNLVSTIGLILSIMFCFSIIVINM